MKSSPVYLIVQFRVKSGKVAEALRLFAKHESDGRSDAGNLEFRVFQDVEDDTKFSSFESWEDEAAIEAHDGTEHHAEFLRKLAEIQAVEKVVQKLGVL